METPKTTKTTKTTQPATNKELSKVVQRGINVHLSNVNFVLRDISALLDASWGLVIAHFTSLSVEAIERRRGEKRHGREA